MTLVDHNGRGFDHFKSMMIHSQRAPRHNWFLLFCLNSVTWELASLLSLLECLAKKGFPCSLSAKNDISKFFSGTLPSQARGKLMNARYLLNLIWLLFCSPFGFLLIWTLCIIEIVVWHFPARFFHRWKLTGSLLRTVQCGNASEWRSSPTSQTPVTGVETQITMWQNGTWTPLTEKFTFRWDSDLRNTFSESEKKSS